MNKSSHCTEKGLSLVELLVAMALSLVVLAAATASYLAGHRASKAAEARLTMQQDARSALGMLARDLRMAGIFGCAVPAIANINRSAGNNQPTSRGVTLVQHYPIAAVDSFDIDALGISISPAAGSAWLTGSSLTPLSDLIVVQFGQGSAAPSTLTTRNSDEISWVTRLSAHLPDERSFSSNTTLLALASCQRIDFLKVDGSHVRREGNSPLQLSFGEADLIPLGSAAGIQGHHQDSLDLMRFVSRAYLVARLHGKTGLYQFEIGEDGRKIGPIEIAANVSELKTEFGTLDNCNSASNELHISYSAQPDDWRKVDLARLTLTMQNNAPGLPKDSQHSYSSTVALRGGNLCLQAFAGS
jgi:type IV pilus assembly protein PilW